MAFGLNRSIAWLAPLLFPRAQAGITTYSHNSVCLKHRCVNPIFPALRQLGENVMENLEKKKFACIDDWRNAKNVARFCSKSIGYHFSVIADGVPGDEIVEADHKAVTAYASHLSGMGIDAWDYNDPWLPEVPDCVKDVWKLVCYTYFPKCNELDNEKYLRPCQSTCKSYIQTCGIECCDEGVQCIFTYDEEKDGNMVTSKGYVNHNAPSVLCTGMLAGAASQGAGPSWLLFCVLICLLELFPSASAVETKEKTQIQAEAKTPFDRYGGYIFPQKQYELDIGKYEQPHWRTLNDYTIFEQKILVSTGDSHTPSINSCETPDVPLVDLCSGNGKCITWDKDDLAHPILFCKCEPGWAGIECNIARYSQLTAFLLSLFLGFLGADLFYLGYPLQGTLKLLSLGGCGLWWLYDIVNIGSGLVYAWRFRVAGDFPHWAYVLGATSFFVTLGFCVATQSIYTNVRERRRLAAQGKWPK